MQYNINNPIIVQSDNTLLIEQYNPLSKDAVDQVRRFAELDKALEHMHTYVISRLSLWNAASIGITADYIIEVLSKYSKFPIAESVLFEIRNVINKYGIIQLIKEDEELYLITEEKYIFNELINDKNVIKYIEEKIDDGCIRIKPLYRGHIKHELIKLGFPVEDLAGFIDGDDYPINLVDKLPNGNDFKLRDYQQESVDAFYANNQDPHSSGVVVLPCGAGKTVVAIGTMAKVKQKTLILVTNTTSVKQWKKEIIEKTDLTEDMIGEYSGDSKEIRPITIATYQIIIYRKDKESEFNHFHVFNAENWGLLIYDEVHLLPASVFKITSEIQSKRRLGLTATLVREDGKERDVFSLIGPKKFDVSWKELEGKNFIATAVCKEVRVELADSQKHEYSFAKDRQKFRIACENIRKEAIVEKLIKKHDGELILIIGQYIEQLESISAKLGVPLITGSTAQKDREELFEKFKTGQEKILVVSKVANFSVDLPDASIAIQISGTFGSRQEEAQRLGRIVRPKKDGRGAIFYSVISKDTVEQDFALKRQGFLAMQGYKYEIFTEGDINENF